jgi:alkanesulfonate monooxygenase SsuD/methylene tetrahydromethanopterin reductase-like flavin-dependent oxidoreductase (luciferase family)
MDIGIVVRPELAPETLAEQARRAEAAGFRELWLWEDAFFAGGIAAAATALAATERIVVGLGIMPAPVRNAAFAAMEIGALARLHPGRFHAGIGHGVDAWMRQVGAKPASQLTLLDETVSAIRALLAGATVSVEGRYVRLRDVVLDHPPATVPLVSVGVRGPMSLELAGRVADGTVLDSSSSPAYVRWARERIDAGGSGGAHRVTVFAWSVSDPAAAHVVERYAAECRAEGGPQAPFLEPGAPLSEFAVTADDGAATLAAFERAGADCVVLVSPDARAPLDAATLASLLAR